MCDKEQVTREQVRQNIRTIQAQTRELGDAFWKTSVTCGDCGRKVGMLFAYRCYYCGIFFCVECAEKHFGKKREEFPQFSLEEISA